GYKQLLKTQKQLENQIKAGEKSIDSYLAKINLVKSMSAGNYKGDSGSSGSSSADTGYSYHASGYGVSASGNSETDALLNWMDRVKNLGKSTTEWEIRMLKDMLNKYSLTADEKYEIDYRLYQAQQKLMQENQQKIQQRLDLVKAAYEELISNRVELYKKQADAAKEAADKEIAALDALKKKRSEDNDDAKRKAELDKINAELKYKHLDEISRLELLRKKQDLINEQAQVNFERDIEQKKEAAQIKADTAVAKYDQAVSSLNALLDKLNYFVANQSGTVTNQQIVTNNNQRQNINIVSQGLSSEQLKKELTKALYS
ncbi:MAG: hypothetical protein IJ861_11310, partial [Clostridia bacterium]|nr:hypothetical protein [Clostridia bacterium]